MTGIDVRHKKGCERRREDGQCCGATFQAHVFDKSADNGKGRRIRKTFSTKTAAKLWRQDALVALRQGTLAEAKPNTTVREACDGWLTDARAEIVRTRAGDPFKPGTIRAYEQALRLRVYRPSLTRRSTACGVSTFRISSTGSRPTGWRPRRSTRRSGHSERSTGALSTATSYR